jgi:hypothetical protein
MVALIVVPVVRVWRMVGRRRVRSMVALIVVPVVRVWRMVGRRRVRSMVALTAALVAEESW